ncbi:MAG: hypothetical protein D4R48_03845 [Nitrosomonadales bacterium]|nr:MAG: hypothetical protein D4R48_03845 [Nitrosomonadales bacterium]
MKKVIVILFGCFLPAINCFPASMSGAQPCGVWANDRKQRVWVNEREEMGRAAVVEGTWLAGYLSGIADGTDKDFLRGTDVKSIEKWMDNYCKANPFGNTVDGAGALAKELMKQKGLLKK